MSKSRKHRGRSRKNPFEQRNGLASIFKTKTLAGRFIQTLVGFALGVFVCVAAWNFFTSKPSKPTPQSEQPITPSLASEYERIRDTGTPSELTDLLISLAKAPDDGSLPVRLNNQVKRIEIADKIINHPSVPQRNKSLAVAAKIKATGACYGIDYINNMRDPDIANQALAISSEFFDSDEENIAIEAQLLNCKIIAFEFLKSPSKEAYDSFVESVQNVSTAHPKNTYVFSNVALILKQLHHEHPDALSKLVPQVVKNFDGEGNEKFAIQISRLEDQILIATSGIVQRFRDDWIGTPEDQLEMKSKMVALAGMPNTGRFALEKIAQGINWLETLDSYDTVRAVCTTLVETSDSRTTEKLRKLAKDLGTNGIKRIDAIGKKWEFSGIDQNGNPIDPVHHENTVNVIMFWSTKNPTAISNFERLYELLDNDRTREAKITTVVVNNPDDKAKFRNELQRIAPNWTNIGLDDKSENIESYLRRFPVVKSPYMIIVDRSGMVRDINIKLSQFSIDVANLIAE